MYVVRFLIPSTEGIVLVWCLISRKLSDYILYQCFLGLQNVSKKLTRSALDQNIEVVLCRRYNSSDYRLYP